MEDGLEDGHEGVPTWIESEKWLVLFSGCVPMFVASIDFFRFRHNFEPLAN